MNDAPSCWGKYKAESACCVACEYAAACRYCTETEPAMNRPVGGQDYDSVSEWAPDLADYDHTPGCEPEEPEAATAAGYALQCPSGGRAEELAAFLNFILHLDDYTLGILAELIAPTRSGIGRYSVAELARLHGISRQGMHRKVLDVARKSPELAGLLAMSVKKIQKARRDFTAPRRPSRDQRQPELPFR